jgi:hypothetical protein
VITECGDRPDLEEIKEGQREDVAVRKYPKEDRW